MADQNFEGDTEETEKAGKGGFFYRQARGIGESDLRLTCTCFQSAVELLISYNFTGGSVL
jgi:hypothetical protein